MQISHYVQVYLYLTFILSWTVCTLPGMDCKPWKHVYPFLDLSRYIREPYNRLSTSVYVSTISPPPPPRKPLSFLYSSMEHMLKYTLLPFLCRYHVGTRIPLQIPLSWQALLNIPILERPYGYSYPVAPIWTLVHPFALTDTVTMRDTILLPSLSFNSLTDTLILVQPRGYMYVGTPLWIPYPGISL